MTEQLKTLMDREADRDFAVVDLDAITAAGDRTVRRRRVATGVAGVAAIAVIATTAALLGGDGDQKTDFVDTPFRTDVPMWTEGSTLHTPERTYDLGTDAVSFVRTSEGVVFTGWEGEEAGVFGVYSFTGEGDPERVGETDDPRLTSDPEHPFVGWLDMTGGAHESVVLDQGTGERVWTEPARREYSFPVVAIDGSRVFLAGADEGPNRVLDLVTGEVSDWPASTADFQFVAAEGELVANWVTGEQDVLQVGPAGEDGVAIPTNFAEGAVFSPGGRWISVFGDHVSVHDTTSGERVEVDTGGYPNGLGYDWADEDTLLAIAGSEEADEIALLRCEIPAGTCEEVASLGSFEEGELFAISFGEPIWAAAASGGSASVDVTETVAPPSE